MLCRNQKVSRFSHKTFASKQEACQKRKKTFAGEIYAQLWVINIYFVTLRVTIFCNCKNPCQLIDKFLTLDALYGVDLKHLSRAIPLQGAISFLPGSREKIFIG